ncbi:unnamed protein product, partial [Amoebophrya sp. A120]
RPPVYNPGFNNDFYPARCDNISQHFEVVDLRKLANEAEQEMRAERLQEVEAVENK